MWIRFLLGFCSFLYPKILAKLVIFMRKIFALIASVFTVVVLIGCLDGGPSVPDSSFAECKQTAAQCATLIMDGTYDCTSMCKAACSTSDSKDIMSAENIDGACQKTTTACGYCIAGDPDSIQKS